MSQKATNSARSGATSGSRYKKTTSSRSASSTRRPASQQRVPQPSFIDHFRSIDDSFRGVIYVAVSLVLLISSLTSLFGPLGKDLKILAESVFGVGIFVGLVALLLCGRP